MKAKVTGNERLVRDTQTMAILNTDHGLLRAHQSKMAELDRQKYQDNELNKVKNELAEIKDLLSQLLKSK